ncbi:MAG: SIS domain-containing protein [Clostridia bacterium]|nr:SIS domain-containing protein [Clostridia bacterium]
MASGEEADPRALAHYERLFERYPALEGCREAVMTAYRMLEKCFRSGGKLLLVGNGGSCADCEHIAGELMKGFYLKRPLPADVKARLRAETDALLPGAAERFQGGLPAIALTGHPALTTAVQNDLDPLMGPAQQVVALGRPGDVVLGISTSGNARNVALAVKTARALGLATLGLAGGDGGRLREICDAAVVVPGSSPADVQELHLPVYHALCAMIEATFFDQ